MGSNAGDTNGQVGGSRQGAGPGVLDADGQYLIEITATWPAGATINEAEHFHRYSARLKAADQDETLGEMHYWIVEVYGSGRAPAGLIDQGAKISADLEAFATQLTREAARQEGEGGYLFEGAGPIVFIDAVFVEEQWRGQGLGRRLVLDTMRTAALGMGAVIVQPAPLIAMGAPNETGQSMTPRERHYETERLRAWWENLGFSQLTDDLWYIDLAYRNQLIAD